MLYATLRPDAMDARTEPPSEQRIAEARARGLVPRTWVLAPALTLAGMSAAAAFAFEPLRAALVGLMTRPLVALAERSSVAPGELLRHALATAGALTAVVLLVGAALSALGIGIAQGLSFCLRMPKAPRRAFAKPEGTRGAVALLAGFSVLAVAASASFAALRASPDDAAALLTSFASRLALALLLVGVGDAALARAAFWRSLWTTRRDKRAEDRDAYGSLEMREARERARKSSPRSEAGRR